MVNLSEEKPNEDKNEKLLALDLVKEINGCTTQLNEILSKLNERVQDGEFTTEEGISLLDVKNQLMLQYLANIINFMMCKMTGKKIEGNSIIDRLIELRVVLERIRPIEQKLKYQIEKLVKIAVTGINKSEKDPSSFKANPSNMISTMEEEISTSEDEVEDRNESLHQNKNEKIKKSDIYVPPKLAAVHYTGDESERKARAIERAKRFARNSSILQELKEEYLDVPIEVATTNSARQTHNRHQKMKQEYEESNFTRLQVTKEERKRNKRLSTLETLGNELTHFEDISVLQTGELRSSKKRKRGKSIVKKGKSMGKKKRRK